MKSIDDLTFHCVWNSNDLQVRHKIIEFWKQHEVLDETQALQRVDEAVYTIYDSEQRICGISTVNLIFHKVIESHVYLYRCFIAERNRAPALDALLLLKTRDYLEESAHIDRKAVGLVVVAQTLFLKRWNKAVWPDTEMMYIGNTEVGDPVRIYYFKGSKINT
ncbi:MAG: hypothetical protein AAF693_09465 [Bacteroidota bacterium]